MKTFYLNHLHVSHGTPETQLARARVLMLHGIGEHSGRHRITADFLLANGFDVVQFDLRGMGLSKGDRMWINKFEEYVDDARSVQRWIESTLSKLPLFVFGHSLGGATAIHFAAAPASPIQGLVLSAPGFRTGDSISPMVIKVGKIVGRVLPRLKVKNAIDIRGLSRDPDVAVAYAKDPLCATFNPLKQGIEILKALEDIPTKAKQIKCPTLILHGTADSLVLVEGSREIIAALASPDKTLTEMEGGYHELHLDLEKERFFGLLKDWLLNHIP